MCVLNFSESSVQICMEPQRLAETDNDLQGLGRNRSGRYAIKWGFIQEFLVRMGKMMCVEPRPYRGVWGMLPQKFTCSEGAYG